MLQAMHYLSAGATENASLEITRIISVMPDTMHGTYEDTQFSFFSTRQKITLCA
jgi:hypothetical protein